MKRRRFVFFGFIFIITLIFAIDLFTGRWIPNIIEHIGAGFLVPFWSFLIINLIEKNKFLLVKQVVSVILYLTGIIIWEQRFNFDFIFGIIGLIVFTIYSSSIKQKLKIK